MAAALKIIRDTGYADHMRAYAIVLDGKEIGKIREGESKEFPLTPGEHSLALKIDWCGSKKLCFRVSEGETKIFSAKSNLRGWKLFAVLWHAFFAWNSYLRLDQIANKG